MLSAVHLPNKRRQVECTHKQAGMAFAPLHELRLLLTSQQCFLPATAKAFQVNSTLPAHLLLHDLFKLLRQPALAARQDVKHLGHRPRLAAACC